MPVSFPDIIPVGSIVSSMLTEAQFQAETSSGWVLCDGRSVTGSRYAAITGASTAPDARGLFLRGKNNSRSDGKEDPGGEIALGTYQADRNKDHIHQVRQLTDNGDGGLKNATGITVSAFAVSPPATVVDTTTETDETYSFVAPEGGTDGRPRHVVINWFIRIN